RHVLPVGSRALPTPVLIGRLEHQVDEFVDREIAGQVALRLQHLAQLAVRRLDGVRRVDGFRIAGEKARNGDHSANLVRHAFPTDGYFFTQVSSKASRACSAASMLGAV